MTFRQEADSIVKTSINAVLPGIAVKRALEEKKFSEMVNRGGKTYMVAMGKAAWTMAESAAKVLGNTLEKGIVITKYEHVMGEIPDTECFEAGHPVLDENSVSATQKALDLVSDLTENDTVLFLVSGGGSALFEKPLIPLSELADINKQLLACGAEITEINTIRKRLSAVKGGKFAELVKPAKIFAVVLSDILGDPLDMIASGPAFPDSATKEDALEIVKKYDLKLTDAAKKLIEIETPKSTDNVETIITGSVRHLCEAVKTECEKLGYKTIILTDQLSCVAKEAGTFLANIAKTYADTKEPVAFIAGGETVVQLTGKGKGGRNQEIAFSSAKGIDGLNACVFSFGSDGTDGPTDAAGGFATGETKAALSKAGYVIDEVLKQNDSYPALKTVDGLIVTGPTGTNVNDAAVLLIRPK